MKIHPQIIKKSGTPIFVVLPYEEYKNIIELLEDIEDIKAVQEADKDGSESFPLELMQKIATSKKPIKAFREYRNISQADLARTVGVSRQYINQLENSERTGSIKILKAIAQILMVDLDDIMPNM